MQMTRKIPKDLTRIRNELSGDKEVSTLLGPKVSYEGYLVEASRILVDTGRADYARRIAVVCDELGEDFWARLIRENILGEQKTAQ